MHKKALTEADIRTKFITPALVGVNGDKWDLLTQIREEVYFTKGRVIVRGKTVKRGVARRADYILVYKPNLPLARIKEALLTDCNLHSIVRLPNGVFNPYTSIRTNLLFFTKGRPTTEIWYYEHPYPPGAKSYNKGKPIRIEEFAAERAWWGSEQDGFAARVENEQAWRVSIDQIKAGGFNLDLKNPHQADDGPGDLEHLLPEYERLLAQIAETRNALKTQLMEALNR